MAIGESEVELTLEATGAEHIQRLCVGLEKNGFRVRAKS
jgi:hypothetical protein